MRDLAVQRAKAFPMRLERPLWLDQQLLDAAGRLIERGRCAREGNITHHLGRKHGFELTGNPRIVQGDDSHIMALRTPPAHEHRRAHRSQRGIGWKKSRNEQDTQRHRLAMVSMMPFRSQPDARDAPSARCGARSGEPRQRGRAHQLHPAHPTVGKPRVGHVRQHGGSAY